jgi:transcriptional repressor NrdR
MRCPFCQSLNTHVKDSRPAEDGAFHPAAARVCGDCGGRFTTFERVQLRELTVVKRDGTRQTFDRDKLLRSVSVAARKRPLGEEQLERLVSGIVRQLESTGETDIQSDQIGLLVMDALKGLDDVAYVRFASVYKDFREARDFEEFVEELASSSGVLPKQPRDRRLTDDSFMLTSLDRRYLLAALRLGMHSSAAPGPIRPLAALIVRDGRRCRHGRNGAGRRPHGESGSLCRKQARLHAAQRPMSRLNPATTTARRRPAARP